MFLRPTILAICVFIAPSGSALADVSIQRTQSLSGQPVILVKGEFAPTDDPSMLALEVDATGATIVTFDSNGGDVATSMAYGRTIRSLGLSTIQMRSTQCASACTLAFVGGVTRGAEPHSIGVHQTSLSPGSQMDGQTATANIQAVTAEIMTYLIEMGVDPRLLQLSLSVPSYDLRYLTAAEMDDYDVTSGGQFEFPTSYSEQMEPDPDIEPEPDPEIESEMEPEVGFE